MMCRVLLLTRCVSTDQEIEATIRKLGHEVFCSVSLVDLLINGVLQEEFLNEFQSIVLSETISNEERAALISQLRLENFIVIKLTEQPLTKEAQLEMQEEGISHCLTRQDSLETVREALSLKTIPSKDLAVKTMTKLKSYSNEELLEQLHLTKLEKRVFEELLNAQGAALSREQLCRKVWKAEATNSTQSQLSSLVKKIKAKLDNFGIGGNCIQTQWGRGYVLNLRTLQRDPYYQNDSNVYSVQ